MNKAYLERLQKSEHKRVKTVINESLKTEALDLKELFKSKVPIEIISKGRQPFVSNFDKDMLPSITLFGKTTLLEICPHCECVDNPDLLKPFLERGVVLPALCIGYENYSPQFAEVLLSYPHLSSPEFLTFRNTYFTTISIEHAKRGFICKHCVDKRLNEAEMFINKSGAPDKAKFALKEILRGFAIPSLQPYMYPDYLLLEEVAKSLREKDFAKYFQITSMIGCVSTLRTAQAYSTIPQMSIENLESLETILAKQPEIKTNYDIAEVKDFVLKGLKLSYSPSSPVETYLDIIEPRKQEISSLVKAILERARPQSEVYLSSLQKEVERINDEVRSLESSKKAKLWNLSTNFVRQNKGLVAGAIVAAGLGLAGAGLVACGIAGAGLISKGVGKYANISLPKEAGDLTKGISDLLEPGYEKLLGHYLSKDIEIIQVWRLQKALKDASPF